MEKTLTLEALKVFLFATFSIVFFKKAVVIGHKQDKERNSLLFIIQLHHSFHEYKKRIDRTFQSFLDIESLLVRQKIFLFHPLSKDFEKLEDPSYDDIIKMQNLISDFLEEVFTRADISCFSEVRNFLELDEKFTTMEILPPKMLISLPLSDELSVSDFFYEPNEGFIIATVQNSTVLSKLGRVWSIIEPEVLGFIRILKNEPVPGKLLPGFQVCFYKEYESKVMSVEFIPTNRRVLYGFHDGGLCYFDFSEKSLEKPQTKSIVFSNECIIQIIYLNETKCLIVMPTALKIVETDKMEIIGGGSLKQRLNGAFITTASLDIKNSKIFIGSSKGEVYLYELYQDQLRYLKSFMVKNNTPIERFLIKKGNLFCAVGLEVSIWNLTYNPKINIMNTATFLLPEKKAKKLGDFKVTALEYLPSKKIFISGLSNGVIMFWNANSGELIGAICESYSQVTKLFLDEERDILLGGFYSGDLKIWKIGELSKAVQEELKH